MCKRNILSFFICVALLVTLVPSCFLRCINRLVKSQGKNQSAARRIRGYGLWGVGSLYA